MLGQFCPMPWVKGLILTRTRYFVTTQSKKHITIFINKKCIGTYKSLLSGGLSAAGVLHRGADQRVLQRVHLLQQLHLPAAAQEAGAPALLPQAGPLPHHLLHWVSRYLFSRGIHQTSGEVHRHKVLWIPPAFFPCLLDFDWNFQFCQQHVAKFQLIFSRNFEDFLRTYKDGRKIWKLAKFRGHSHLYENDDWHRYLL